MAAVLGICYVETLALVRGIDGVALSASIGALGTIGGWMAKGWRG